MSALTDRLGDKLGPLPVWAWGAMAGAGILGVQWYRNKGAASTGTAPASDTIDTGGVSAAAAPAASPTGEDGLSFAAAGTYVPPAGSFIDPSTQTTTDAPTDNESWAQLAITRIVARDGSLPVLLVTESINKALNGEQVTEQQAAIYETGLRLIGPPPYAVPTLNVLTNNRPIVVTPPPRRIMPNTGPVVKTPPATGGGADVPSVTVKVNDTLWGIVKKHYGTVTTNRVRAVAAAQTPPLTITTDGHVNPWQIGQVVILPPGL